MTITYETGSGLYVNLTNRCTNNCDFCVRTTEDGYYGDLWLDREPTADDLSKYTEVVFCGYGEPTMRLDVLLAAAKHIKEISDLPTRINTNGLANLYFGRDVTPELEGLIDVVSISLCAASAEEYDSICHSRFGLAAYDGLIEFARLASRYVSKVKMTVVDTTIPPEDIEKCREIARSAGAELRVREFIG